MKDIDFDELDRAVASALGTSAAPDAARSTQPVAPHAASNGEHSLESPLRSDATGSIDATRSNDDTSSTPVSERISSHGTQSRIAPSQSPGRRTIVRRRDMSVHGAGPEVASPPQSPTESPLEETLPPEARVDDKKRIIPHRVGRAMDVVAANKKPVGAVSRVATTVAPVSITAPESVGSGGVVSDIITTKPPTSSFDLAVGEMDMNHLDSDDAAGLVMPQFTAPEPLESESATDDMPVPYETELTTLDDTLAKELEQPVDHGPAISPFISDAKVTKRPLGGSDPIVATPPAAALEPVDLPAAEPVAYNEPTTPAELDRDIVAVELQELDMTDENEAVAVAPQKKPTAEPIRSGPTAITRQYKETPRNVSEDDESGAIFDPQNYHTAIEHPKKQSSGWGWVIAIISIILLAMVFAVLAWMEGILPVPL